MLAPDFFQPLRDFAAGWHDRAAATAVAGELAALGQSRERLILGTGAAAQRLAGPAQIETRGLAWRSPSGRLLSFPDLSIAPGDAVAILGASGAGKSTLLALLAGLAKPEAGRLTVAGLPLGDVTADAWRARLGWVGQAPHFLAATLRANLALGGDRHDEAALARALTLAQAGRVVVGLPRGLATRLGETGGGVSGGEARRLVLARAAFAAPDVLLADEPTADLDAATAAAVTDGLLELGRAGATLILATHDLALARRMDRVIALEATCARS
jgi:ATP-binding cassette subfamily C protein CydD